MTNEEKIELFKSITQKMADIYEKKNRNYGNSFSKLYEDFGPIAGLIPLHNKLDRITALIKGEKNDFESLEDSLLDLANYCILNLIEMRVREEKKVSCAYDDGNCDGNCLKCMTKEENK